MASNHRSETTSVLGGVVDSSLPIALIIAAMFVAMAALLPVVQSSGATTRAGEIRALQQEKAEWQARLRELEVGVAEMGSLSRIEQEAHARWNMGPPQDIRYLTVDAPAPQDRRLPSRYLPRPPQEREAPPSLWEDLFGWLPLP